MLDYTNWSAVVMAQRLQIDGNSIWRFEDIADVNSPDFVRRFATNSDRQIVMYIDQDDIPASVPSGAEPPQGSLPRVDQDAATMTRAKVDYDLKDLVKKLSDPALPEAQKGSFNILVA